MKTAAIFPGQGAQLPGMGKDVYEQSTAAREVFDQADHLLDRQLSQMCFDGQTDPTDIQQPAIFVTSVALFRAAVEKGVFASDSFAAMGGLSLGEYTALHLAGALSFEDALRLVTRRGQLMQQASEASAGGMVSVLGLDEAKVNELCAAVAEHGKVSPANFNAPGQVVISGDQPACDAALERVGDFGGKGIALKVAGAFHSHLMTPAAEGLSGPLSESAFVEPTTAVIANVDAAYHGAPEDIRAKLVRQVDHPVRWQMCCDRLIADGVERFYEVGPNRVLTGLLRKINRDAKCVNLSTAEALDKALA